MALSDFFSLRKRPESEDAVSPDSPGQPTKVLGRFLASLQTRTQPVILDLGPVVGSNVNFFGEQLGCKIFVENLFKDIDRHAREGTIEQLPDFLEKRFPQEDASVDGILCWDVFDFLDRKSGPIVARQLSRILKPDGALLAIFSASEPKDSDETVYTRFVVAGPDQLQYRTYPAAVRRGRPLQNRDIQRMFEPLRVTEQFLLKSNVREVLFRKAAARAASTTA